MVVKSFRKTLKTISAYTQKVLTILKLKSKNPSRETVHLKLRIQNQ
jgi:hypothetical protein